MVRFRRSGGTRIDVRAGGRQCVESDIVVADRFLAADETAIVVEFHPGLTSSTP